jgi:hypothetical protein
MVASTTTRPSAVPNRVQRLDHLQPPVVAHGLELDSFVGAMPDLSASRCSESSEHDVSSTN